MVVVAVSLSLSVSLEFVFVPLLAGDEQNSWRFKVAAVVGWRPKVVVVLGDDWSI